jgi:hypothetical protein
MHRTAKEPVDKYTHYRVDPDGQWWFHDARQVYKTIQPGFYSIGVDPYSGQPYLKPRGTTSDDIVPIPNPHASRSLEIAQQFIRGEFLESLGQLGLLNKMAQLLWGEPGTSKSVTVYQIVDYAVSQGWVVLDGGDQVGLIAAVMKNMRQIEPDRGIVVVWEEFDRLIGQYENEILQLLDGSDQLPNVLYVMTTNYIQNVPKRIFTRCRRIPFQVQFEYPGPEERRAYFEHKIPPQYKEKIDVEEWVKKTEGFSIDHCAQVLVGVFAYKQSVDEVIDDLKARMAVYGDGFRQDAEPAKVSNALMGIADDFEDSYGYGGKTVGGINRFNLTKLKRMAAIISAKAPKVRTASRQTYSGTPLILL